MTIEQKIKEAKETLEEAGYYVGNLWTEQDVTWHFDVTPEQAQDALDACVASDWVIEQINVMIGDYCTDEGYKKAEDEANNNFPDEDEHPDDEPMPDHLDTKEVGSANGEGE